MYSHSSRTATHRCFNITFYRTFNQIAELPSLPINREISRKYSKINPISPDLPVLICNLPQKNRFVFFARIFRFILPAHPFASCESSTVHGKCREQPSGDYRSISNRRVCDLLTFKVNASCRCYGIKLDRGLADGVRKAVSKAKADLAVARAEEPMMEMKTLEEHI